MSTLISKASLLLVPSVYEDGTLYNVLPSGNKAPDETGNHNGYDQTRADFTFSRGFNLTATRVNADGLIEKGRENLLTYSNDFSQWTNSGTTEASGFEGYDGTNDAWEIEKTSASAYSSINKSITATSGIVTISAYVKKGTLSVTSLYASGGTNPYILFSFDSATITAQRPGLIDTNVEDAGNGWYRISFTTTESIAQVTLHPDWAGTNTGTIYAQDIQVEKGLVATDVMTSGATTATAGVLENTPRIDYSSGTGALLLEPQRTNSVPYSEGGFAYSTSTSGTGVTPVITENAAISPEGVKNAFKVVLNRGAGNTSGDWSWIYQNNVTYYNGDNRVSVYLKAATISDIGKEVFIRVASDGQAVTLTEDWKRHDFNRPTSGLTSDAGLYTRGGSSADNEVSCFVYGFQVEQNASYPSSYVPTYGSAATRGADSCSVTGVSDVIGQTEGTLFVEFEYSNNSVGVVSIHSGNIGNRVYIGTDSNGLISQVRVGYVQQAFFSTPLTIGTTYKCAIAYKANDFALYVNGSQIGTDTSGSVPSSMIKFGFESGAGGDVLNQPTKQTILFDTRLTNSELATLTTL